ncbi:MAG: hypothetical protein ABWZ40_13395 [Caulobacterales bacterium]
MKEIIAMETGDTLPVAPLIPTAQKFQSIEVKPAPESEQVEIITDTFHLSKGRLVVEQDPETRRWIYTTVDVETGKVLSQFPVQSLTNLRLSKDFGLGLVFDARV